MKREEGFRNVFEGGDVNAGGGKDERSGAREGKMLGGGNPRMVGSEKHADGAKGEGWFRDGGRDGTWFVHFPERSARFLRARS